MLSSTVVNKRILVIRMVPDTANSTQLSTYLLSWNAWRSWESTRSELKFNAAQRLVSPRRWANDAKVEKIFYSRSSGLDQEVVQFRNRYLLRPKNQEDKGQVSADGSDF